jgi:sec-independent protein translocase protein TatA
VNEKEVIMGLSPAEIVIVLVVIILLFGAKKLPELARSLGRASYEFKKAKDDILKESKELADASEKAAETEDKAQK